MAGGGGEIPLTPVIEIPETVRNRALVAGRADWLEALPGLVADIAGEWSLAVGRVLSGGTEALVVEVERADGTPAVLKLLLPHDDEAAAREITVLRLANGEGCAQLLEADATRGAMLLERLGRSMSELALPVERRHEILCSAVERIWRPAPDCSLPTGAEKGRWLADFIADRWEETGHACSERAVEYAVACALRRASAHDDERAVLVHGDVHQWNALEAGEGFKLVDPDGLLAEPEYDLGVLMREDPLELLAGDPWERAARLAHRTGLDATAIWEWGVAERVSTGLLCVQVGLQPVGSQMLEAADQVAELFAR